jgi:hypothetical protein
MILNSESEDEVAAEAKCGASSTSLRYARNDTVEGSVLVQLGRLRVWYWFSLTSSGFSRELQAEYLRLLESWS